MRVGLLTQWYEPEPGPAALPAALARGLVDRGHEVQVLTGYPNYPTGRITNGYQMSRRMDEVRDAVRVRRVALLANHDTSAMRRAANYASFAGSATVSGLDALRDIDALWVNYSPITIGLPMFAQRWLRRTPTVVHVLDLWPDTLFASGFGRDGAVGRAFRRGLDRWCGRMYAEAHSVAYVSPGVGEVLADRGVPRAKLSYAPMWADESAAVAPSSAMGGRGFGLGRDTVALVYAGTLGGAQDLATLIRAVARVDDIDFQCLIAGTGTEEQGLRAMARSENAYRVRFLGHLDRVGMRGLMTASDLHYVGLNRHPLAHITMPSKVQAILASHRPVVASLDGDAADVIKRAGGWAVPPADIDALAEAIRCAVAQGREGLARRGAAGRLVYESEFSYADGVDRIERLLVDAAEDAR